MVTLQFVGIAVGFAGMLLIRYWLDQNKKTFVLVAVVMLLATAPLWPLTYFGSLGLYISLQIVRILIAWKNNTTYDIPIWAYRLV